MPPQSVTANNNSAANQFDAATSAPYGPVVAERITILGRIQGLGVRPAVARLARLWNLNGFVANSIDGLQIEIEGADSAVAAFRQQIPEALPAGTVVRHLYIEPIATTSPNRFVIHDRSSAGAGAAEIPVDQIVCDACAREVTSTTNRRANYPFTSCTRCGPRYSILQAMPFDRAATAMNSFPLCENCLHEYTDEDNRRFHAQTNACSSCGPRIWLTDTNGVELQGADFHRADFHRDSFHGDDAIHHAAKSLLAGQIVALKGIGGYQLLADATSPSATERLRSRKGRTVKPLAIMVRNLAEAEHYAELSSAERAAITNSAGPIVVARRRNDSNLAEAISWNVPTVGLMLPTTPLHLLLLNEVQRPVVVTSGNREGNSLAFENSEAEKSLAGIADLWLHHNRQIVRPIDDSVVRVINQQTTLLRCGRGYAPLSLPTLDAVPPIIALGGQMKNAIAIWNGSQAVLGPHIGDLDDISVCSRWEQQLESLATLLGVAMDQAEIVCDAHPDYFTTRWSQRFPRRHFVQHHHAHIASTMLEHGLHGDVLGLAWDGTGYGTDGTIWGGEAIVASRTKFQRVATLRPFPLIGGEMAIREPWRIAVALVADSLGSAAATELRWSDVSSSQIQYVAHIATQSGRSPQTSSLGRLFDAIAAIVLRVARSSDDAHAAMLLEHAADQSETESYVISVNHLSGEADWRPLIRELMHDLNQKVPSGRIAMRFHRAIANWGCEIATGFPELPLVIGGGCFQNAVLRSLLDSQLTNRSSGYFFPRTIPPGDGGLAAGQLAVVAARLQETDLHRNNR